MGKITITAVFLCIFCMTCAHAGERSRADERVPDGFHAYILKENDSLRDLVPDKNARQLVYRINKIDENHLRTGMKILLPNDHSLAKNFCPVPREISADAHIARSVHVFIKTQYFGAYENGTLVFWGPVSTGAGGKHETPKGTFLISEKHEDYFSHSKESYGAPMPFAQRLTGDGVFLHQQKLPGKPASHGCIRLLMSDAQKLFDWTRHRDPVTIE